MYRKNKSINQSVLRNVHKVQQRFVCIIIKKWGPSGKKIEKKMKTESWRLIVIGFVKLYYGEEIKILVCIEKCPLGTTTVCTYDNQKVGSFGKKKKMIYRK